MMDEKYKKAIELASKHPTVFSVKIFILVDENGERPSVKDRKSEVLIICKN